MFHCFYITSFGTKTHQNLVQVPHLHLSFLVWLSHVPLLLKMDCLHWWHDWLCPRGPRDLRFTLFSSFFVLEAFEPQLLTPVGIYRQLTTDIKRSRSAHAHQISPAQIVPKKKKYTCPRTCQRKSSLVVIERNASVRGKR